MPIARMTVFKREFGLIIIGGLVFTASFLWKDFLTDVEEAYFPKEYGLFGRFVFVIVITALLITMAIHLKDRFGLTNTHVRSAIRFDDQPINDNDNQSMYSQSIDTDTSSMNGGNDA